MAVCAECEREFTPLKSDREICYEQGCIDAREAKRRQAGAQRRSQMRKAGTWAAHARLVHGIGRGNAYKLHSGVFRVCLSCHKSFEVPLDTDWYICSPCHAKHNKCYGDCDDEALGISDYSVATGALGDGASRKIAKRGHSD